MKSNMNESSNCRTHLELFIKKQNKKKDPKLNYLLFWKRIEKNGYSISLKYNPTLQQSENKNQRKQEK